MRLTMINHIKSRVPLNTSINYQLVDLCQALCSPLNSLKDLSPFRIPSSMYNDIMKLPNSPKFTPMLELHLKCLSLGFSEVGNIACG